MPRKRAALLQGAILTTAGLALVIASRASAANLCVNPNPRSGCAYATIGAAVDAAAPGDTIAVAAGRYAEDVHILKPLSLIGAGPRRTIVDAKGLANGFFIDGIGNSTKVSPGNNTLTNVTVTGFTVQNANFEGILALNATNVTLWGNRVAGNDRALKPGQGACPGIPAFETNEGDDCGEGIHLIAVDHSTVVNNTVENNAGGVLLSDETGPTDTNLIQQNEVRDNVFDCGITMASHSPAAITGSSLPFGVFDNTIAKNESTGNGTAPPGGAGVGMFAPGPHNQTYGNVVVGNRLTKNGMPGVAIHNHAPTQNIRLADNVITGNFIAGNGADPDVEASSATAVPTGISLLGVTPVTGTLITLNQIQSESTDIAINNAAGGVVVAHLNNLVGHNATGIANFGAGLVDATENWWGCPKGPGARGCTSVSGTNVSTKPFLTERVESAGTE